MVDKLSFCLLFSHDSLGMPVLNIIIITLAFFILFLKFIFMNLLIQFINIHQYPNSLILKIYLIIHLTHFIMMEVFQQLLVLYVLKTQRNLWNHQKTEVILLKNSLIHLLLFYNDFIYSILIFLNIFLYFLLFYQILFVINHFHFSFYI